MWKFLKYVLATFVGTLLGVIVLVLIGIGVIAGITSSVMSDSEKEVEPNSILVIKLDKPIVEVASHNPFKNFDITSLSSSENLGLHDIVSAIIAAKDDNNIKGIFLTVSNIEAGISTVDEIRNALIRFKESGKFIISYNEFYSQNAYYLASVADKVYLKPEGLVEFKGLTAQVLFFKDALQKIGVTPQVIRHGKFKSAVEPLINDKMSPENRAQVKCFVDGLWQHIANGISAFRTISVDELNRIANNLDVRSAQTAVQFGLVDTLKYYDQVIADFKDSLHVDDTADIESIEISDYISMQQTKQTELDVDKKMKIAVIVATGDIVSGEGEDDNIGGERMARAIRAARRDKDVKAIVFRINSGGGSALASESVWRESKLAAEQKTFIVSMGDVAASGGYYIACPADLIVANPTTITGSIGVFGILPDASNLMKKIGVSSEVVTSNDYSDIGTITRPLKSHEQMVIEQGVDDIYKTFITHVGEGRTMAVESVDSIGQGRVWTGNDALKLGLIDMVGDMQAAIKVACDMEKITDYRLEFLPESDDPFNQFVKSFSSKEESKIKEILGDSYIYFQGIQQATQEKDIQARLPYMLILK